MMRVESQQVAIRHLKTTDAAPLFENYLGDEQGCRFLNRQAHQNVNQTLEAIERWRAQYDQKSPNLLVFTIEELTSQTPIGCLVQDSSEIHFGISARYQVKGYATQACKLGVVYLQSLGITRIRTAPHIGNLASIRVLEKCGFISRGILKAHAVFPALGREVQDCMDMRLEDTELRHFARCSE
ncbi:GNAT family N-acetyltransferase [Vibrio parahaemolyticus]|uniref:GNAT family N-acetyltransferase n=1 Tax=Vibrio parahaemolyticus TaxID=670 RepID=UPI001C4F1AA9|nr:GNAT family protein [Vibrio parahaemolyticus]